MAASQPVDSDPLYDLRRRYRWLAEHEIEPLHSLPRELWRYRVSLRNLADLTGNGVLAELGLPDAIPGREVACIPTGR